MSNNGGHLTIQYNLRWSEELRDKIAAAAKENTRSMNQEIIDRLEKSFDISHSSTEETSLLYQKIDKLTERVLELSAESREMRMLCVEAMQKKHG